MINVGERWRKSKIMDVVNVGERWRKGQTRDMVNLRGEVEKEPNQGDG